MVSGGADSACAAAGLDAAARRRARPRLPRQLRAARGRRRGRGRGPQALRRAAHRPARRAPAPARRRQPPGRRAASFRYDAAERLRDRTSAAAIATGHTRTDVAETLLYRLATSPGLAGAARACAPRNGRVVRPLLGLERERVRELADGRRPAVRRRRDQRRAAASPATGSAPRCCRSCATSARRPSATSPRPAPSSPRRRRCSSGSCSRRSPAPAPTPARSRSRPTALAGWEPGLRRLALRALAERACGPPGRRSAAPAPPRSCASPAGPRAARSSSAAASSPVCERGHVRFRAGAVDAAPTPVALGLPGPRARRRLGGPRRAAPGARSSPPGPIWRRSTPPRSTGRSRSAPGATATASARSGCAGPRRSRTSSRTAGVPRSLRATLPGRHRRRRGRLGRRRRRLRGLPPRARAPSSVAVLSAKPV